MFVLEAPVISFNPKAFLWDELFRQCFPKLSLISADPERAFEAPGPACEVSIFFGSKMFQKNSKPACFFLWTATKCRYHTQVY